MRSQLERRNFLLGLLSCSCCCCAAARSGHADPAPLRSNCLQYAVDPRAQDIGSFMPLEQFSASELVSYFRQLADHIKQEERLLHTFFTTQASIYLELQGRDAHASPGYVGLGLQFVQRYAPSLNFADKLKISGLLAHETAHTFQFEWKLDSMLANVRGQPVKYVELHADYLAGAYMAWREKSLQGAPAQLSELFYRLGDRALNSADHHGTEHERLAAFSFGYLEFQSLTEAGKAPDVKYAATTGILYVKRSLSAAL